MKALLLSVLLASPVLAQDQHQHHHMPGMAMPALETPSPAPATATPPVAPPAAAADPHGHHHATPAAPPPPEGATGTDSPAGDAAPPPVQRNRLADRFYGAEAMAPAEAHMLHEHGSMTQRQLILNLAERQFRDGRDGYRWDGQAWFGGDIHRFALMSEGEATRGQGVEAGEVQALYSRAVDPYWNLQAGVRQDIQHGPDRTYATVGVEGVAPYWFDLEARLFLSNRGDVLARLEGHYDQRLTQRLILQPRVEINLAAQDVAGSGIGSGLSTVEAGLRLRYEIVREFAPYVGFNWERRFGDTARFARLAGEDVTTKGLVAGIRFWF
ncbi:MULTISPECIES: copper resistance protein B [unclassified Sphingomonas]|uniref:copper resistance protein B n=1 Tax=unclassified Sphingomonas TaxID=196159 RepID=UPI0006F7E353|nr:MULTISPECIES: copper resistance protein B [unclassified Sphingomonas]KQX24862.1 copper resistance protein CopB [Sphingomonas sp. Root1294]KQY69850.1 copper resistance protein CopB [Sphingomonas sp. Root50]KRB93965.1 copper resistance protein CopB [Sphingomonas sp. Root720]